MNEKLLVIISTSEVEKARTGLLYTINAKRNKWINDIKLIFFGPSEKLLLEDEIIQQYAEEFRLTDESVVACKFIAEQEKTEEKLTALGIEVEYVGEMISNYIKDGYIPMVW